MLQKFSIFDLGWWISNFEKNAEVPFKTNSALITLEELESFVTVIKKQKADSVRIYFLRFRPEEAPTPKVLIKGKLAKGCTWDMASPEFSQATIAMVPAKNFKHDKDFVFSADDIIIDNSIETLMPGIHDQGTGLNPPSPGNSSVMVAPK